jgi:hypothetical protein
MHPPGHPAAGRAGRQAAAGAVVAAWIRTDLPARETRSTCRRARCGNRTLRTSRSHDKHDHKDRDPGTTGHTETRPHHAICARASFHLPSGTQSARGLGGPYNLPSSSRCPARHVLSPASVANHMGPGRAGQSVCNCDDDARRWRRSSAPCVLRGGPGLPVLPARRGRRGSGVRTGRRPSRQRCAAVLRPEERARSGRGALGVGTGGGAASVLVFSGMAWRAPVSGCR